MTPWVATADDIPAMVEMGRRFHAMSPHKPVGPYDADAVARVLAYLIAEPAGVVLTNGSGVIGGLVTPVYFSPGVRIMEEQFWWAADGGRDLLKAFEDEARKMGAAQLMLSTLENDKSAVIDRVVTRLGYTPLERRYMKELNP